MPIIIIINPLSVHALFLNINEEDGPIKEILCSMNTEPIVIKTIPKIIR